MKKSASAPTAVLTVRISRTVERQIAREARRRRRTRSDVARELLETALAAAESGDPALEARRQSQLASDRVSERDALDFIATAADLRGWK